MNRNISPIALVIVSALLLSCNYVRSFFSAPTPTARPASIPSPTSALLTVCTEFELTPEECTNAGTHEYSTETEIAFDATGSTCRADNSDRTISLTFHDHDSLTYTEETYDVEMELTRKADNLFEGTYTQADGQFQWQHKLTFTGTGFTLESASYDLQANAHLCTFLAEETIIAGKDQPASTPSSSRSSERAAAKQEME